jgi:hypothetical protein
MRGRKRRPGTEARLPGRAPQPASGELAGADGLGPRGGAVEARSPWSANLKRRPLSAHRALAEGSEQREACLEDWRRAGVAAESEMPLLLALTRLTPELSRPAAGRRLSANIAEGAHLGAALMWVRLERVVRHLPRCTPWPLPPRQNRFPVFCLNSAETRRVRERRLFQT